MQIDIIELERRINLLAVEIAQIQSMFDTKSPAQPQPYHLVSSDINKILEFAGIDRKALYSRDKTQRVSDVRRYVMHLLNESGMNASDIARHFGRHHATVMYNLTTHDSLMDVDPAYKWMVKNFDIILNRTA